MRTAAGKTAAAILGLLLLLCVWRAATQSIVHDEAFTWQLYLTGRASAMFRHFDPNHHFLHTVLMRVATQIFGYSELAMRLPALLGAGLFFVATWRFCRWAVGDGWRLPLAVAVTALNPLVLDFLAVARGYGLGLALWMWALALAGPELARPVYDRRRMALAGLCAALSVTANLIFAPLVLAFFGLVLWLGARQRAAFVRGSREAATAAARKLSDKKARKRLREAEARCPRLWRDLLTPAAATGVVFLILSPVWRARGVQFIVGTDSVTDSLRNLASQSFGSGGAAAYQPFAIPVIVLAMALGPAVLLAGAAIGLPKQHLPLLLASFPAVAAALLIGILHFAFGMLLPVDRTGLYLVLAAALSLVLLTGESCPRPLRLSALTLTAAVIVCFAAQLRWQWFAAWPYDADTARIAQRLEAELERAPARVAHSWELEPALNFYRITRRYTHLPVFERHPIAPGPGYYVLIPKDGAAIETLGLRTIYRGPASDTVLAEK